MNEKICKMIEILEKRQNKFKTDLLKKLKTEENLKKAVRIFHASDETWCKKTCDKYKDALYQAETHDSRMFKYAVLGGKNKFLGWRHSTV